MPNTFPKCTILIAASNLQEASLLNSEFAWLRLPASHATIFKLFKNILEADEEIGPVLDAWAASGDMNDDIHHNRVRRVGVQVWLTNAETTHEGVRAAAEDLAIEAIPPRFIAFNESEARAVSNFLGC